jgi:NTP pyrophosphatase (non-canonical NTP hydrolase)
MKKIKRCDYCNGAGFIPIKMSNRYSDEYIKFTMVCPKCKGTKHVEVEVEEKEMRELFTNTNTSSKISSISSEPIGKIVSYENNEKGITLKVEQIKKDTITANDYQRLAMRTCSIPYEERWNMISHAVMGLASEAGEVAGLYQKTFQGHEFDEEHLKKELGDCLWMIAELCTAYGWDMSDIMELNIKKLKERYPDGFDPEKSKYRKKGDV